MSEEIVGREVKKKIANVIQMCEYNIFNKKKKQNKKTGVNWIVFIVKTD